MRFITPLLDDVHNPHQLGAPKFKLMTIRFWIFAQQEAESVFFDAWPDASMPLAIATLLRLATKGCYILLIYTHTATALRQTVQTTEQFNNRTTEQPNNGTIT